MTVDRELITRKLLLIAQDLDTVAPFATKPASTFLGSRIDQAVVERLLERMIGRMIDVNYHLITESGQPPPADYHASFLKLAELSIVDPEFARRIARCAGLRNRLVHEYEDIDPRKVFDSLQAARNDILTYMRCVETYLNGLPER
ncbi:MAG: hypothetical protein A3G76_16780 [Acidobacteria bacterium RIFCSPLOWO2_12_FULL_65_11]|nr:MAG: hypothetical protein A3H95_12100 [Acidobacteria bacterium RIFCSPLOWO2_02_FULL_64_15]OFW34473.1 MAG: hypothetical protein A3G76_16780 [Acidobacteria bacterium RIFCSPLOWO2_12_FULL_65_11]